EHEAASHSSDATKVAISAPTEERGLVHRFQQWWALHQKQLLLWPAKSEAEASAAALALKRGSLEEQAKAGRQKGTSAATPVAPSGNNAAQGMPAGRSREESSALMKETKARSVREKALATLGKRIDNEKQLGVLYGQWIGVVTGEQRR